MKITIITINRNNAKGLQQTLASVQCQSVQDFEHVIVDGASTDESVSIIRQYAEGKSNVQWVSEPDTGVYNAMNKGIRMAHGQYCNMLNSGDCYIHNQVIAQIESSIQSLNYPPLLVGLTQVVDQHGQVCHDGFSKWVNKPILSVYDMLSRNFCQQAAFYSRDVLQEHGLFDEQYKILADYHLNFQLLLHNIVPHYLDYQVVQYQNFGMSASQGDIALSERQHIVARLMPEPILSDYRWMQLWRRKITLLEQRPIIFAAVNFVMRAVSWVDKKFSK